jgi:3'-phosphoadenosine 5'-phosphosulfate (PAPS) 3'-phosphatase
LDLSG